MPTRYLLVGNPTARSGAARRRIELALERMNARSMKVKLLATAPAGRTVELVRRAIDGGRADVVVYLGGDGTFAEAAKGILAASRRPPLGMLPSGTANDQGRSFGISAHAEDMERNLDVIEAGHLLHLDVGKVSRLGSSGKATATQHVFHSVGWGMQAVVLRERNRDRENVEQIPVLRELYRDQAVYAGAMLRQYFASWVEPTKFSAKVLADGRCHRWRKLTDLIIKATPYYGGAWVLARDARPDDGKFELIPVRGRRDFFAKAFSQLAEGPPLDEEDRVLLGLPKMEAIAASSFEIALERADRPEVATQVDGEEWVDGTRFRLAVEPRRLPIITPRSFEPHWRRHG